MSGLFTVPKYPAVPAPPPPPSLSTPDVEAESAKAQQEAAAKKGRASTILTNPQSQRRPQENQQQYLGGVL